MWNQLYYSKHFKHCWALFSDSAVFTKANHFVTEMLHETNGFLNCGGRGAGTHICAHFHQFLHQDLGVHPNGGSTHYSQGSLHKKALDITNWNVPFIFQHKMVHLLIQEKGQFPLSHCSYTHTHHIPPTFSVSKAMGHTGLVYESRSSKYSFLNCHLNLNQ